MVYLPPSEYKPFSAPPEGLKKYKNTKYLFVESKQKEIVTKTGYTTFIQQKYVSLYQWWFQYQGRWYMHLNEYIGQKKGENFGKGWARPSQAFWIDAEGNKFPYEHPNKGGKK